MTTLSALAALLAVLAGIGVARRRRRLSAVAPELRHPALYLPLSLRGRVSLRSARWLGARLRGSAVAEGVALRADSVPADGARPALRVLGYEPPHRDRPSGALLWIHGGGLVMGTPEQDHDLCSGFAERLGIAVVSVDYRLAPDHPFPAALEDCYAALAWLHARAGALGVDPAKVAVGGASAGGGLAACLAQLARERGGPAISLQLLVYPMLDDRTALRPGVDALIWTHTSNHFGWSAYLGHAVRDEEPRPYAAAARCSDLRGLPPAWLGIGDIDLFRDECVEYGERLRAAGVACETCIVPGMYHGADRIVPAAPSMRAFVDQMTFALRAATRSEARP